MTELQPMTDQIPEYVEYHDDGCDLFPSCLNCPFPRCRYDEQGGKKHLTNKPRDREIVRLYNFQGRDAQELAEMFGVSKRTVYRIIRRPSHE